MAKLERSICTESTSHRAAPAIFLPRISGVRRDNSRDIHRWMKKYRQVEVNSFSHSLWLECSLISARNFCPRKRTSSTRYWVSIRITVRVKRVTISRHDLRRSINLSLRTIASYYNVPILAVCSTYRTKMSTRWKVRFKGLTVWESSKTVDNIIFQSLVAKRKEREIIVCKTSETNLILI